VARVKRRSIVMAKFGFALSVIAAVAVIAVFVLMIPRWDFAEMVINMRSKLRMGLIMLGVVGAVLPGFAALLMGLEGAAECQGRQKTMGWFGFVLGAVTCMAGIILGLCFVFCRI